MSTKKTKPLVAGKSPEDQKNATATTEAAPVLAEEKPKEVKAEKPKKEKAPKAEKPPKEPKQKKEKPVRELPAHMAKVDKFAASLPTLSESARNVFEQAEQLESGDLNVLSAHLNLLARKRATSSASAMKVNVGDRVKIESGIDTRFIGKEGTVTRTQRIRIFVKVPGFDKDAYLFASNVRVLEAAKIDISDDAPEESTEDQAANG